MAVMASPRTKMVNSKRPKKEHEHGPFRLRSGTTSFTIIGYQRSSNEGKKES